MRIIPVIDLKNGVVVRGIAGRRDEYRPIQSRLCSDARPQSVGRAFAELGFRQVYLADLDAIAGGQPAWATYEELLAFGLHLLVDAGTNDRERAAQLAAFHRGALDVVAGLESLAGLETLREIIATAGPKRLVFSLDMKHGQPLVPPGCWPGLDAQQVATLTLRAGVRRMIVLDLARVGVGEGAGTEPLCRQLAALDPRLEIIAGGGIRGPADLDSLARAGCAAALVASALHDGRLVATSSQPEA